MYVEGSGTGNRLAGLLLKQKMILERLHGMGLGILFYKSYFEVFAQRDLPLAPTLNFLLLKI